MIDIQIFTEDGIPTLEIRGQLDPQTRRLFESLAVPRPSDVSPVADRTHPPRVAPRHPVPRYSGALSRPLYKTGRRGGMERDEDST